MLRSSAQCEVGCLRVWQQGAAVTSSVNRLAADMSSVRLQAVVLGVGSCPAVNPALKLFQQERSINTSHASLAVQTHRCFLPCLSSVLSPTPQQVSIPLNYVTFGPGSFILKNKKKQRLNISPSGRFRRHTAE